MKSYRRVMLLEVTSSGGVMVLPDAVDAVSEDSQITVVGDVTVTWQRSAMTANVWASRLVERLGGEPTSIWGIATIGRVGEGGRLADVDPATVALIVEIMGDELRRRDEARKAVYTQAPEGMAVTEIA